MPAGGGSRAALVDSAGRPFTSAAHQSEDEEDGGRAAGKRKHPVLSGEAEHLEIGGEPIEDRVAHMRYVQGPPMANATRLPWLCP